MVQEYISKSVADVIGRARAPTQLSGIPDLFQNHLYSAAFGARVGFAARLDEHLKEKYQEADRDGVYRELLDLAIEYDRMA